LAENFRRSSQVYFVVTFFFLWSTLFQKTLATLNILLQIFNGGFFGLIGGCGGQVGKWRINPPLAEEMDSLDLCRFLLFLLTRKVYRKVLLQALSEILMNV
jgi:hypothetical protein